MAMCGRFVGFRRLEELLAHFPIDRTMCEVTENFNVAPSQEVLAIFRQEDENILDKFHWGLVPFWAKDMRIGTRLINARAETVADKPSFRQAFKYRRCLILADGFYEWQGTKGNKQPVFITRPEGEPFAFAGLWEQWRDAATPNAAYRSCTIITTAASASLKAVHHRMPAVPKPQVFDAWLDSTNQDIRYLQALLANDIHRRFIYRQVSKQVNAVGRNEPSNIVPLKQATFDFEP
jgi:putative SOS response-associated peptidase YedK